MSHKFKALQIITSLAADKVINTSEEALLRTAISETEKQEPVAWMHWLNGPCRVLMNKDEAMMELDRLNREYPVDGHARKVRPLVFGDTTPPAAQRQWVGLTDEQRKNLWVSATIESPSHENCYYRGIADSEAYHGITEKGQP